MKKFYISYCSFQIFSTLFLWLPIFYEYQKYCGLDDSQIFTIQSVYYCLFCFLEIPTGFIADYFGRLKCLRAGAITLVLSHIFAIFFTQFTGFLVHFILLAMGRSLLMSAGSAYLYDRLSSLGQVGDYKKVEGRAKAASLIGRVVCWPVVGFLVQWHWPYPYWLTGLSVGIAFCIAMTLPSESRAKRGSAYPSQSPPQSRSPALGAWEHIGSSITLLARSPQILGVILQGVGLFVMGRVCQMNLFQPILTEKSFSIAASGMMMSAMSLFEALGAANASLLRRWLSDFRAIFMLSVLATVSFFIISFSGWVGAIFGFCLFSLVFGMGFPIQRQLLNDAIPNSQFRATLLAIEAFMDRACCAGVVFLIGPYLETGSATGFLNLCAGTILVVLLLNAFVIQKLKFSSPNQQVLDWIKV